MAPFVIHRFCDNMIFLPMKNQVLYSEYNYHARVGFSNYLYKFL